MWCDQLGVMQATYLLRRDGVGCPPRSWSMDIRTKAFSFFSTPINFYKFHKVQGILLKCHLYNKCSEFEKTARLYRDRFGHLTVSLEARCPAGILQISFKKSVRVSTLKTSGREFVAIWSWKLPKHTTGKHP